MSALYALLLPVGTEDHPPQSQTSGNAQPGREIPGTTARVDGVADGRSAAVLR